jgi:TetR/AcrR family transcriptional repressor of nem operon
MRVSKDTMAEHREQIIAAAANRFRERGFDGISVADLMKEVGLTHGGFYGHFSSKEELVALASLRAMRDTATKWRKVIDEASGDPMEALVKSYLSLRHHDHPQTGCLFAALGSDLSRQPSSVKDAATEGQQEFLDLLGRIVPGKTNAARRKKAIVVLSSMIGGMILARTASNPKLRQEVLDTMAATIPSSVRASTRA